MRIHSISYSGCRPGVCVNCEREGEPGLLFVPVVDGQIIGDHQLTASERELIIDAAKRNPNPWPFPA